MPETLDQASQHDSRVTVILPVVDKVVTAKAIEKITQDVRESYGLVSDSDPLPFEAQIEIAQACLEGEYIEHYTLQIVTDEITLTLHHVTLERHQHIRNILNELNLDSKLTDLPFSTLAFIARESVAKGALLDMMIRDPHIHVTINDINDPYLLDNALTVLIILTEASRSDLVQSLKANRADLIMNIANHMAILAQNFKDPSPIRFSITFYNEEGVSLPFDNMTPQEVTLLSALLLDQSRNYRENYFILSNRYFGLDFGLSHLEKMWPQLQNLLAQISQRRQSRQA